MGGRGAVPLLMARRRHSPLATKGCLTTSMSTSLSIICVYNRHSSVYSPSLNSAPCDPPCRQQTQHYLSHTIVDMPTNYYHKCLHVNMQTLLIDSLHFALCESIIRGSARQASACRRPSGKGPCYVHPNYGRGCRQSLVHCCRRGGCRLWPAPRPPVRPEVRTRVRGWMGARCPARRAAGHHPA